MPGSGGQAGPPSIFNFHPSLKLILSLNTSQKLQKSMKNQFYKGNYYQNFNFLNISQKFHPAPKFA